MQRVRDGHARRKTHPPLFSWRGVLSRTRGWDLAQSFLSPVCGPGSTLSARRREQLEVGREAAHVFHERELVGVGLVVDRIAASVAHRLTSVNMIAKTTGKSEECSGPGPRRHRRWARTAVRDQRATRAVRSTATSRASVAGLWPIVARRAGGYGGRPEGPRRERSERGVSPKRGAWAGSASGAKRERQRGGPCTHRAEHRRTTTLNARRFL